MDPYTKVFTLGAMFMGVVYVLIAALVSRSRLPRAVKALVWVGLLLRVVGVMGRMTIAADANVYFAWAVHFADYFVYLDPAPLTESDLWRQGRFLGTNFVAYPAALIAAVIGPSFLGLFLGFALVGFAGLCLYGLAFQNALPRANLTGYWGWLCLFPSLWFWPSSIGKEALMMLGLGIATYGYLRRTDRANWALTLVGLALVFAIRPQVVAVFVVAVVAASWLEFDRWTPARVVQGIAILGVGLVGIWFALGAASGAVGLDETADYVAANATKSDTGDSAIGTASLSPLGVVVALSNVLFRPFIWEAHNLAALVSAVEVMLMWGLIVWRWGKLRALFQVWRRHRALRFAVAFTLLYTIALGMNLGNLGIIARQRVLVFPLLFMIVEAGTMLSPQATARAAYALRPRWGAGPSPAGVS